MPKCVYVRCQVQRGSGEAVSVYLQMGKKEVRFAPSEVRR